MGTEVGILRKKRIFCFFCFFPLFWPFLAAGWCFFMFFGVFLFFHGGIRYKHILWYQGSIIFLKIFGIPCFSDVFWQSVFLFFSLMQVVLKLGAHIYGRCGMWDVGSLCHGMNMCKCECKSMMTWQIEVQWGPHIYRRCGIWDFMSICHGMYTCYL